MIPLYLFLLLLANSEPDPSERRPAAWGFQPHKLINRHAIFTLPPSMLGFYKHHMHYLSEEAVKADHRRYAVPGEAARHYIDLDFYGLDVTRQWNQLVQTAPKDSIEGHGILPWHLVRVKYELTQAFRTSNTRRILRLSADSGHYLADAHVPLHTTVNYNGQLTGQHGIHGFWETRIPELLHREFDLWVGKASYQENWQQAVWIIILESHKAVDSVLKFERLLTLEYPKDRKHSYEVRLSRMVKVYSAEFTRAYHQRVNKQVERRLRAAIKAVGDFWYTCWVDAGQPDLNRLKSNKHQHKVVNEPVEDRLWRQQHWQR